MFVSNHNMMEETELSSLLTFSVESHLDRKMQVKS